MNRWARALILVFSAGLAALAAATGPNYVEGEVLVHYRQIDSPLSRAAVPMLLGAKETASIPQIGWHKLSLPTGLSTAAAIKLLSAQPGVDRAEPNYIRHITQFVPTDPDYKFQYGPRLIGCEAAWPLTLGSSDVTIGFVDTGIDLANTEFVNRIKIANGCNIVGGNSSPIDDNDHGTHVAGIATAALNNGVGIAGVCPTATILPVKVLDASGSGTIAQIAQGYMFAADNGADIINASLGGTDFSQTEQDAVNYVLGKGKLFVAAAGNSGDQGDHLFYPAAYTGVIGVGAVDSSDVYQSWSQYGSWVKVAAPGVHVYSTYPNGQYAYDDGTSMSCPHVAGALALLKGFAGSGVKNTQIQNALFAGCQSVGNFCQYGRVSVYTSLQLLSNTNQTTQTAPYAVGGYAGYITGGNTASLASVDSNDLLVAGYVQADQSQIAGFQATYLLTQNVPSITRLGLSLSATAPGNTAGAAYAYNFLKGRFDLIGKFAFGTGLTTTALSLHGVTAYIRNGAVRILVITVQPAGPPYTLSVDQAVVTVTTSSSP
jgi:thermitase